MKIFLFIYMCFLQEFQIDTTTYIRPASWLQWFPDVEYFDTLFIVIWETFWWGGSKDEVKGCRITKDGKLIDTVAIDLFSQSSRPFPRLEGGDTICLLTWWDGLYPHPHSHGMIIKKDWTTGNNVIYPTNLGTVSSIGWDGSYFFAVFNNGDSITLGKIDREGNLISTNVLNPEIGNLKWETCIEWNDSIGIVVWGKYSPLTRAAIINHEGIVLNYITVNQVDFRLFKLAYTDSIFMLIFLKYETDSLYFQRFSYEGELIDYNPVFLTKVYNMHSLPKIVAGNSKFHIFWHDSLHNIWMCRVEKNGTIDTILKIISEPAICTFPLDACFNGENFYLVWPDLRDSTSNPYIRREEIYGAVLDINGIPSNSGSLISYEFFSTFNQLHPFAQGIGNRFFIFWEDERKLNKDIYLKIFNKDGNPLQDTPYIFMQDTMDEKKIKVAYCENNLLVCWEKNMDLYGQILDSLGNLIGEEIIVCNFPYIQTNLSLTYSDSIYFCVWEDQRNGFYPEIYGARIKINGEIIDTNGILISTAPGGSFYPKICAIDTIFLVVWEDRRNGNPDIYACRVTKSGIVLEPHGIPVCTEAHYQKYPATRKLNDKFIIIWQDLRNGNYDLYFSRIDLNGNVLEPDGIPFIATGDEEISPFIPASNIPFVMWYRISSYYDFLGGIIDTSGNLLYYKKLIPDASYRQNPSIFIMPDSTYFIVYEKREQNEALFKIYGYIDRFINIKENYATRDFGELRIFPTITNDKINITPLSNYPVIIYIYDQTGRKVNEVFLRKKFLNLRELNLSTGIYYLKVFDKLHKIVYIK